MRVVVRPGLDVRVRIGGVRVEHVRRAGLLRCWCRLLLLRELLLRLGRLLRFLLE